MAAKEIAVKKYVVKLSEAERERLQALINKGKSPAKRLLKARILLKADACGRGEGWSDGRIVDHIRFPFVREPQEFAMSDARGFFDLVAASSRPIAGERDLPARFRHHRVGIAIGAERIGVAIARAAA